MQAHAVKDQSILDRSRAARLVFASIIMWLSPVQPILAADQNQKMEDQMLQTQVEALLREDGRIDWLLLAVKADRGQVTLIGEVLTQAEKGLAENLASIVPGVADITNSILVSDPQSPDLKLKKDVYQALLTTPVVREDAALKVNVAGAVVKLQGTAGNHATQEAAVRAAKSVSGVKDVINEVRIGKVRHHELELQGMGRTSEDRGNKEVFVP